MASNNWSQVVKKHIRPCPQCVDNEWFERVGILKEKKKWHDEVVAKANETAKTWACSDVQSGNTSLSWDDFYLHHFSKAYLAEMVKKRKEAIDEYSEACYKKRYGENEKHICSYHGEFRC